MNDFAISIIAIVIVAISVFAVAVGFLVLFDRYRYRVSHSSIQLYNERYRQRLSAPDFESLEKLLGHKLPDAVIRHFRSLSIITDEPFEILPPDGSEPLYISFWCPCDLENYHDTYPEIAGYLMIAMDGGNVSYVIDPRQAHPCVLSFDAESGELEQVAESLDQFLSWPKRAVSEIHGIGNEP